LVPGFFGGSDAIPDKGVGALCFLGIHVFIWIEVLNLGSKGSGKLTGIKFGDGACAALTSQEGLPGTLHIMTQGGDHS
jgi:hypothetical protein